MDREQQIGAIILRLTGVPPGSLPASFHFDEPWRSIYRRVRAAHSRAEAATLLAVAIGPEGERLVAEMCARLPKDSAFPAPAAERKRAGEATERFPSLQDIPAGAASVPWLWPCWIPCRMVTLLAAAPGVGKSLVALDLARRIMKGEAFPDGAPALDAGRPVVLVDAEVAPGLLRQRVAAWQMDASLLFPMLPTSRLGLFNLGEIADAQRLHELCRAVDPALVIVDSLASAAPKSETSLKAARDVLVGLSIVAQVLGPAVLVISPPAQEGCGRRPT